MKPEVILGGERLGTRAGDLEWVTVPQGTESIQFDVTSSLRAARAGQLVEVDYGGVRRACGQLKRPVKGERMEAEGLHRLAEDYTSFTAASNVTLDPDEAVSVAIGRGLPWVKDVTLGGSPVALDPDRAHSVAEVLDAGSIAVGGQVWAVLPDRRFVRGGPMRKVYLETAQDGLGVSFDGYASVLYGRFNDSASGVYQSIGWADDDAIARWGRVERTLSEPLCEGVPMGVVQAGAYLAGLLAAGQSEIGWTRTIEIQHGDAVTEYGQPVDPDTISAWEHTVRLKNVRYAVADIPGGQVVDMRLGRTRHSDGRAVLEPLGLSSPMEKALAGL